MRGVVLCEMLSLVWSFSSYVSCFGAWTMVSDWEMGQIVMGGGGPNGGRRLCNLLSIVRLHAGKPFSRVVLHIVGMELTKTFRVYMMCGV